MKARVEDRIIEHDEILDDLFQADVDVHIEHMGKGVYFIGISHKDGSRICMSGKKLYVQWLEPAVSTQSEETK